VEATNDDLILMAIRKAQRARMIELTAEAIDQYAYAFQGTDAEKIDRAFTSLFAREDSRSWPSPRAVLDEVNKQATKKPALVEPDLDLVDRDFGKAISPMVSQYLRGEISSEEMDQAMVSIARACGAYDRIKGQPGLRMAAL